VGRRRALHDVDDDALENVASADLHR
jgi:hypothetical protein